MTASSWADFMTGGARLREPVYQERPATSFARSWDTWVTFIIVLVAFVAVAASIEEADWVNEMPSLFTASLVGLATGFLLAHVRLGGAPLVLLALLSGLGLTIVLTLQTMELADPLLGTGARARWDELWARLDAWGVALVDGDISTDPMPFVLLVVFSSWVVSFLAAWSVFRWRNGWLAVIPGGFALLTNISYLPGQPSLAFIVFLFASILLVTRMHMIAAQQRWVRERTVRPPFLSLEVLNYATWVGLALIVLAWIVPTANNWGPVSDAWQRALAPVTDRVDRLGRLFVGIDAKGANTIHKFGDVLPLQGSVTLSDELLFTVDAPEDVAYLRAAAYDEYTGNGWRVSEAGTVPLEGTSVEAASFGTPATRAQFRKPAVIDIELTRTLSERRLLAPGDPLAADVDASVLAGGARDDVLGLVPAGRVRGGDAYTTVGTVSAATVETLAATSTNYPSWVLERYLQLPRDLPPEIGTLTRSVIDGAENPFSAARRIEQFLRVEYPYDLEIPDPSPLADGVAHFLFETRRGYFDQHASAMVVMLRSIGLPARIAVGFALDSRDLDADTRRYEITDRSAWTWPEVYFEGLGWVEFNPTPGRALVARAGDDSQFGGLDPQFDGDFNPAEALLFSEDELLEDSGGGASLGDGAAAGPSPIERIGSTLASLLTGLVILGSAIVVLALLARAGWEYRFRGLDPVSRRWAKVHQFAHWAGVGGRTTRTPLESARDLSEAAGIDDLDRLARAYTRERYGREGGVDGAAMSEGEAEALDQLYSGARNRLVLMTARRVLPRRRRRPLAVG